MKNKRWIDDSDIVDILMPRLETVEDLTLEPQDKDILSTKVAAAVLGIRPELLETMAENGEVPGKKFGNDWRFSRTALRRCLSDAKDPLLVMLDKGLSNRDIAEELKISEHTVKVHLWRLFRRLNVKSRSQASHLARTQGLL